MRTTFRLILLAALVGLSLVPAGPAQAAPLVNVQPTAGPPGTSFLFFASGFAARERVGVWLNAPDGRVLPFSPPELRRTTAYGDASWTWVSPADAPNGAWQMVIYGQASALTQVIPFTIGAPPDPASGGVPAGVAPASGRPGSLFRFYATGFEFREVVTITVSGPAGPLKDPALETTGIAGPEGRIDASWTSPADAAPGAWQLVLRGDRTQVERVLTVTITPPEGAPPPQLTVSPASGAPGARFVFSATGFGDDEMISVWLNTPDGKVVEATIEGRAQAAPDGRAGWGWLAPAGATPGTWQMVAHGRTSGFEAVASFTIQ